MQSLITKKFLRDPTRSQQLSSSSDITDTRLTRVKAQTHRISKG